MITFRLAGDKQSLKNLEELPVKMRRQALTRSIRVAFKPLLASARQEAPEKDGKLKKAIKLRMWKRSRSKTNPRVGMSVQVGGEGWYKGETFYGAFQEFGWRVGKRTAAIRKKLVTDTRRKVEGKHFIEQTYKTMGRGALSSFFATMPREVARLKFKLESGGKP